MSVEKAHPSVNLIKGEDDEDFYMVGEESIQKLTEKAKYSPEAAFKVLEEYKIFKRRVYRLNQNGGELVKINEQTLYQLHSCNSQCRVKYKNTCKDRKKVVEPRTPNAMKFLHLFLRKPELYKWFENFLHLLLRCTMKTHAETVAESMGNLVDLHCDKRRGLGVQDVGVEVFIDWNGPPILQ